ncbi:TBC1 domain family member 24-like isoform X3 [Varroa jacobsoni]|uniref:TBC1 domain family member 24 n=1 Tax=Varroa destructor TaxID=109461 RepID=A0A7M7M4S3_VARDE|nr:TBC1 domain family member 24-like isoform X3 [Varroa destructor]XP_022706195.1 TBC1 domain family member 24-like isoform X3 [Varroa jacobsoni]
MQEDNVGPQWAALKPLEKDHSISIGPLQEFLQSDKLKNAKKFVRTEPLGVACPYRAQLWADICCYHAKVPHSGSFYVNTAGSDNMATMSSLPAFVDPIFADDYWLNDAAKGRLIRILNTLAASYSHVLYAPLLYPATALLLHYLPHVEVYKAICSLMESHRVHHMDQTPNMYTRSTLTFQRLTKKLSPKTFKWIEKSLSAKNEEVSVFFLTWPLWLFRGLPVAYLIRVFDNYLLEGTRALYRSCLLILVLYSQYGSTSPPALNTPKATPKVRRRFEAAASMLDGLTLFVRNALPTMVSEAQFVEKAFSIRGFSSKLLSNLAKFDAAEIQQISGKLPIKISSREIIVKQMDLSTLDVAVLYYVSEIKSSIASQTQLERLWPHLPSRFTVVKPYIIFSSNEHGTSLRNFLHMVDEVEPLIILIKTTEAEIFGAFCSSAWGERKHERKFFGTGETFVFTFEKGDTIKVFKWIGYGASCNMNLSAGQQLFQCAMDGLDIGCGALHILPDMNTGRTDKSATFDNEPLSQGKEFGILTVEAVAFE